MIRKETINVYANREVSPNHVHIANQYEIKTNLLEVVFNFEVPDNAYKYLVLIKDENQYCYPLADNKFLIESNMSWMRGSWRCHLLISEVEMVNGEVNNTEALFISDPFSLMVRSININIDHLQEMELPQQLTLVWNAFLQQWEDNFMNSAGSAMNEAIHNSEQATQNANKAAESANSAKEQTILAVGNANEATQRAIEAAERAENVEGKSAYEVAVENGYQGTEKQWIESLHATVKVDDSLNDTSQNPVQNRAIYEEIERLKLTIPEFDLQGTTLYITTKKV